MNKSSAFAFIFGAAAGSAVTWYFLKKKYEQLAQDEIDSVKEAFCRKYRGPQDSDEAARARKTEEIVDTGSVADKSDVIKYAEQLKKEGYTRYSSCSTEEEEPSAPVPNRVTSDDPNPPHVIPPEEFGMLDDYDTISLTYYADQILADDNDMLIEDVEGVVGFESLGHFGEYDDDSVYVRNDRLKVDYEILRDLRKYSDVIQSKPYLRED